MAIPSEVESQIPITLVPEPRAMAYAKADAFQACRIDLAYALSCYQLDYQAVASWAQAHIEGTSAPKSGPVPPPPTANLVARLVLDERAFTRLREELNRIAELAGVP